MKAHTTPKNTVKHWGLAETTNELTLKQINMWTKFTREGRITRHEAKTNQGGTENQNWRKTQSQEVKLETQREDRTTK